MVVEVEEGVEVVEEGMAEAEVLVENLAVEKEKVG